MKLRTGENKSAAIEGIINLPPRDEVGDYPIQLLDSTFTALFPSNCRDLSKGRSQQDKTHHYYHL